MLEWKSLCISLICFLHLQSIANACTVFSFETTAGPIIARNYDFFTGKGFVSLNPRGLHKTAFSLNPSAPKTSWVSRFGSLTFNQLGIEFPTEGMNEAGLVVLPLWLDSTVYPAIGEGKAALTELQWIQYTLDNFDTVENALHGMQSVSIRKLIAPLHFYICDSGNDCAIVEFNNGRTDIYRGTTLPYRALANDAYNTSIKAIEISPFQILYWLFQSIDISSFNRFLIASRAAKELQGTTLPKGRRQALKALETAAQGEFTKWNLLYEPKRKDIAFRFFGKKEMFVFDLKSLHFHTPQRMLWIMDESKPALYPQPVEMLEAIHEAAVMHCAKALSETPIMDAFASEHPDHMMSLWNSLAKYRP